MRSKNETTKRPAREEVRAHLREQIVEVGETNAADDVGVSRPTLMRAVAGFSLRSTTLRRIDEHYAAAKPLEVSRG